MNSLALPTELRQKRQPSRIALVVIIYSLPLFNDDTHNNDLYYGGRGDNYNHDGNYK